jgi:hypothetical protein
MVARSVVVEHQVAALQQIRDVIAKHDPDAVEELRLLLPGGAIPNSIKHPDEVMTVLAKSVAVLAELVDQQVEANAPKKRGRPRKEKAEKDKEE